MYLSKLIQIGRFVYERKSLHPSALNLTMHLIIVFMKMLFLAGSIGILLLLLLLFYLTSMFTLQLIAETQMNEKFSTYQNPRFGFRILYPSDWQVIEENPDRVIFSSAETATIRVIADNVSKNALAVTNLTAHDYALNEVNGLRSVASNVRLMEVTVGISHVPGWRVDYVIPGHYVIDVNLVIGGKRFTISYVEVTLNVPRTLSTLQTMLNSFQVIK